MAPIKTVALLACTVAGALLASCERDIELDYHTVAPHYVAEVRLTPDGVEARLTTTRDVAGDSLGTSFVSDAVVTVSADDGSWTDTLTYRGRGRYALEAFYYEGHAYVADVIIDGVHHTSRSTMRAAPQVASFSFVWQDVLTEKMLFADLRLQDPPDEVNYYFMHLYRNGVGYRWAVMRDNTNPGGELQQLFSCMTKRQMDEGTDSDVLFDGDALRLEVRSIDQRVYDYFYSMQLMDNNGTNPVNNFTGGLLGYFSAYQEAVVTHTFRIDSIR